MKKLRSLVKKQDIFGKFVLLNFDQKGSTHKTFIGGILSIMFYIFVFATTIYGLTNI